MLPSLRVTRDQNCALLPGVGMRIPIELIRSTFRSRAIRVMSWKSEWARLWYHQSCPQKQRKGRSSSGTRGERAAAAGAAVASSVIVVVFSSARVRFGPAPDRGKSAAPNGMGR